MSILLAFPTPAQEADTVRRDRLQRAAKIYLGVKLELMKFGASADYAAERARWARTMYLKTSRLQTENGDVA